MEQDGAHRKQDVAEEAGDEAFTFNQRQLRPSIREQILWLESVGKSFEIQPD